jgi:hypothetical protein
MVLARQAAEVELMKDGITNDQVFFGLQPNGFVTADLFHQWCNAVLLPFIAETNACLGSIRCA